MSDEAAEVGAAEVGAALDAAGTFELEDAEEDVTVVFAADATLDFAIDEDAALEIKDDDALLDTAAEEAGEAEAMVRSVVAAMEAAGEAAAALIRNDPSPQRH